MWYTIDTSRPNSTFVNVHADFHIAMAISIASINQNATTIMNADREIRHVSQTLQLVNQRLSSTSVIQDETIAAVVMMAQYERHENRHAEGLVHMMGLRRMVKLRGGIRRILCDRVSLGQKIIRYVELLRPFCLILILWADLTLNMPLKWGCPLYSTWKILCMILFPRYAWANVSEQNIHIKHLASLILKQLTPNSAILHWT